jgi:hypothetical protein
MPVFLAMLGFLSVGFCAVGHETEQQLLARIQSEPNPVKKAKVEIKLARLQLAQVQDAYSHARIEEGAKLVANLTDTVRTAWKLLQGSGRKASKQPDGFRDLEISLRENVRLLQDLGRTVSFLDRAPLESAAQEMEQIRGEVLRALFPGGHPRTIKDTGAAKSEAGAGTPTNFR